MILFVKKYVSFMVIDISLANILNSGVNFYPKSLIIIILMPYVSNFQKYLNN